MKRVITAFLLSLTLVSGAWAGQAKPKNQPAKITGQTKTTTANIDGKPTQVPVNRPAEGTQVDDATVLKSVKERISTSPQLKDSKIDVAVNKGVVTLTGSVKTIFLKGYATRMAKIGAVHRVNNQLNVENMPVRATKPPVAQRKQ